jgi:prolyl-tRNA synthetase
MVQDWEAVQAGTSHFLGQNFAKALGIQFQSRAGKLEYVWTISWGVNTRLIGTLIMLHADDDGLVLPPMVVLAYVVIIPITPKEETRAAVLEAAERLAERLRTVVWRVRNVAVEMGLRDLGGGVRAWDWIKKGVSVSAQDWMGQERGAIRKQHNYEE